MKKCEDEMIFSGNLIQMMIFRQTAITTNQKFKNNNNVLKYESLKPIFRKFEKNRPYDIKKLIFRCQNGFNQEFQSNHEVRRMLL